ncbi:MAG: glycosyltransferase, partial [Bacteroidales bacterium]|nr:glycosyltransferase [Bacteroidales bacterium]
MKLSVCMITYNHEKYIGQAIEGVLMQKTNFDIELLIGEDFSNDNTRNICMGYKNKYPDKIKLLLREKNIGMMRNFIQTLNTCKGKYIALCDGDDYWTDPLKLQKQVDFLEANPEYALCYHRVNILTHNGIITDENE